MWDYLIRNGFIVDGSGAPGLKMDLAIQDGKIAALAPGLHGEATTEIDATGLIVSPGFMDMHSHADRSILANPLAESALRQGITFVLAGQCGGSTAPISETYREELRKRNPDITWLSLKDFNNRLESETIGINIAMLVGQGTIRGSVMGAEDRPATAEELAAQKQLLLEAMRDGAFGLSTGRRYMPGSLAKTDEIIELNKVIVPFDGIHDSHIYNQDKDIFPSLEELIEIGRQSGSRVHLAHQKVCGKPNWGQIDKCMALLAAARAEGIDILSDLYLHPYTQIISMDNCIREFLRGSEFTVETAKIEANAEAVLKVMRQNQKDNPVRYESILRTGLIWCAKTKEYENLDMAEGMAKMGCDLAEFMLKLSQANDGQVKTAGIMSDSDIAAILKHPFSMVGTDSFVVDNQQINPLEAHPRNYETYPYTIRKFVYEDQVIDLETCIFKMSGMVADRLHLHDRGRLRLGNWADITIFDPQTIGPRANLDQPSEYPAGIVHVWVNGTQAINNGQHTGAKKGQVILNPKRHQG